MLNVAHLTDRGVAILENHPDFARGELDLGIFPLFCHQLTGGPGTPNDLASLSHFELDIVNQCPCGNIPQGEGIPRLDVSR